MPEKTFGEKIPNVAYKERAGAYGIGFDKDGKIPVALASLIGGQKGYFLLGGGIESNELHCDCIVRECLEEAGLSVTPKDFICKGDFYHFIEQGYLHGTGYFYYMEIHGVITEPTETDHLLVWLTVDEAKEKLFLPLQAWAVEHAYKLYIK